MQNSSTVTIDLGTCFSFWINFFRVTYRGTSRIHSGWKCLQKSHLFKIPIIVWQLRALKSPQKFWTPSFANFWGSRHILGLKSKSYYEIWTFWSKLGLQMNQFHSFDHCENLDERFLVISNSMRPDRESKIAGSSKIATIKKLLVIFHVCTRKAEC